MFLIAPLVLLFCKKTKSCFWFTALSLFVWNFCPCQKFIRKSIGFWEIFKMKKNADTDSWDKINMKNGQTGYSMIFSRCSVVHLSWYFQDVRLYICLLARACSFGVWKTTFETCMWWFWPNSTLSVSQKLNLKVSIFDYFILLMNVQFSWFDIS